MRDHVDGAEAGTIRRPGKHRVQTRHRFSRSHKRHDAHGDNAHPVSGTTQHPSTSDVVQRRKFAVFVGQASGLSSPSTYGR